MYFKFIKYLWSEGFKKKIIGPLTISFGTVLAGRSCYDLGKFENIVAVGKTTGTEPMTVVVLTPMINLYKWFADGNLQLACITVINNISHYLKMPLIYVTFIIMFIVSIGVLFLIYYLYKKYIKNLNIVKNETVFNIFEEKLKTVVMQENKGAIVNLEAENMKLVKELAEGEKTKKNLRDALKSVTNKKCNLEKVLKEKAKVINNQKKVTSSKQKLILNLQKKLKGKGPVRKNKTASNNVKAAKVKPTARGKAKVKPTARGGKAKAAVTNNRNKLNFIV